MTNTNNPFGAKVIGNFSTSSVDLKVNKYYVPSTDSTALYLGDFVKTNNTATSDGVPIVTRAAAGESVRGVIVAFEALRSTENITYRTASTAMYVYICDDPYVELEMQVNGTLLTTHIGKYFNLSVASGNAITGLSATTVDLSTASTASAQIKIVGLVERQNNSVGEYSKVRCVIHDHELQHGITGSIENIWKRAATLIEPYNAGDDVDIGTGSLTAGNLISEGNMIIGSGAAGIDYTLTFNGEDNDGVITWKEDEDNFDLSCSMSLNSGQVIDTFSTDTTLGGITPLDTTLCSQKALKTYIDNIAQGLNWQKAIKNQVDFTTAEPGSPSTEDRYINTVTGTSSVTTQSVTATYIYEWNGTNWTEIIPSEGYALWDDTANLIYVFNDAGVWIPLGGTQSFLHLTDTPSSFTAIGAIYNVNGTTDGVAETSVILTESTNTFNLTKGSASLDIAAGAALNVDANLNVESASAINQDLTTDSATAQLAALTLSGLSDGLVKSTTGLLSGGNSVTLTSEVTGVLPIANGGTNSSTALNNDRVIISLGGAIAESADITTAELGLLNGIVSVSTGTGDNDKFVTQGYVDDISFGKLWTTVGNVGSGAEFNSIQDAITAAKYDLAIIGNFTETKDITIGANSTHIKITDTCNLNTFQITMNSTGELTIESGKITAVYSSPSQIITNSGTATLHMSDLIIDTSGVTATTSIVSGASGNRMHIDNCRCFLGNTIQAGFTNCYNSSSIANTTFVGGGASCSGAIVNLAGGSATNLSFEGTFQNLGTIIDTNNSASIINGVMYNATGRGVIALQVDTNLIDNLHGNLEIDTIASSKNQISNSYVSDVDLSDAASGQNKLVNVRSISNDITVAGDSNEFVNFQSDAEINVSGDANMFTQSKCVDLNISGDNNQFLLSSYSNSYIDSGSGNAFMEFLPDSVAGAATYLAAETITGAAAILPVAGNGGAVTLTSLQQLAVGIDGEHKTLLGTHNTNTLTVVDGNGLVLNNGQSFTLGLNDALKLFSYNSLWIEESRSDN